MNAREVCLQPVLLIVAVRGEPKIIDHGIDIVFQLGDLAAGFYLDGTRQVTLGNRGGYFRDGADLIGQVVGEEVHVSGEVLPCAGRAGHVCLPAETAFHPDLARDCRYLVGERG